MNISPEASRLIRKFENRYKKTNLLGSKYLMLRKEVPKLDYGLFAYYINFFSGIEYAVSHDMIPVVDMLNFRSSFHAENEVGVVNAWELFFEQPCGIGVKEALNSRKARYIWYDNPDYHPNDSLDFLYNDELVAYYHMIQKKYVRFKPELEEKFAKNTEKMFGGHRVVGVLARGTDYSDFKPWFHPIQPTVEQIVPYIKKYMEEYDCSHVFVATEDEKILQRLLSEFGDKLLYVDQKRISSTDCLLNDNKEWISVDPIKRTKDYLGAIYALSKCEGIVAGRTSGTVGALLMADNYKFKHIFTYGRYGIDDEILGHSSILGF